jgi:hypothetical protein
VESKSKNQLPLALACGIKIKIKKSIATGFRDCLKISFCKTTFKQTTIFISQKMSSWRFGGFNIS